LQHPQHSKTNSCNIGDQTFVLGINIRNVEKSRSTFPTSARNSYNILMRHLKHMGHTLATYTTNPTARSSSTHGGGARSAARRRERAPLPTRAAEKNGRELTLTPCSSSRLVEQQLSGGARGQPAPEASTVAASREQGRYAGQRGHCVNRNKEQSYCESKEMEVRVDRNNATCGQEISHVASGCCVSDIYETIGRQA
jgi:hypothetical protein